MNGPRYWHQIIKKKRRKNKKREKVKEHDKSWNGREENLL